MFIKTYWQKIKDFFGRIFSKNKDTQEEVVVLEATVWAFWILFFGVSYLLANVIL